MGLPVSLCAGVRCGLVKCQPLAMFETYDCNLYTFHIPMTRISCSIGFELKRDSNAIWQFSQKKIH